MMSHIRFEQIPYGFQYGAATVTRCMSDDKKGWVVLMIETPRMTIQVYVTKTGKVRVYDYKRNIEMEAKP